MSWKDTIKGTDVMGAIRDASEDGYQIDLPPPNAISFTCEICGRQVSKNDVPLAYTSEHLAFWHQLESPECFEKLKLKKQLEAEEQKRKSAIYACDVCGKQNVGESNHNQHKATHPNIQTKGNELNELTEKITELEEQLRSKSESTQKSKVLSLLKFARRAMSWSELKSEYQRVYETDISDTSLSRAVTQSKIMKTEAGYCLA